MRSRVAIFTSVSVSLIVVGSFALSAHARQAQPQRPDPTAVRDAQREAFRSGGFRAAAGVTGSYVGEFNYGNEPGPTNLEELVRPSDLVVIGQTRSNHSVLTPRGDDIRTEYVIHVEEVLKGSLPNGPGDRDIVVSVMGGRVSFPNGTWAQENIRGFDVPLNGRRYALFLKSIPDHAKQGSDAVDVPEAQFWPVHGQQGIFRLEPNGKIRASARSLYSKSPSKEFDGKDTNDFLRELRQLLRRTP